LLQRPLSDSPTPDVELANNPLPFTVGLLLKKHRASPGSGLSPSELLRDLGSLWPGDARDLPSSISYLRAFPALFTVELERRPAAGLHPKLIRLSPAALELASSPPRAGVASRTDGQILPSLGDAALALGASRLPDEARALLAATPLHWLPSTTSAPCPATWGPLLIELLTREGQGPSRRMQLHTLLPCIQTLALRKALPLPPNTAHWFALTPHAPFARIKPVWEEEMDRSASSSSVHSAAVGAAQQMTYAAAAQAAAAARAQLTAVELVPEGSTALDEDISALARLAEQVRLRAATSALKTTPFQTRKRKT
jgi:hypothetical protein